jgi:hypothetical protein
MSKKKNTPSEKEVREFVSRFDNVILSYTDGESSGSTFIGGALPEVLCLERCITIKINDNMRKQGGTFDEQNPPQETI